MLVLNASATMRTRPTPTTTQKPMSPTMPTKSCECITQSKRKRNFLQRQKETTLCFWIDSEAGGSPMSRSKWNWTAFGQSRLSGRSGLLYNYEDNGGLWENLRFSPLSLLGEDETSVSFVLRTHSTMFHLLHRTTSKSKGVKKNVRTNHARV